MFKAEILVFQNLDLVDFIPKKIVCPLVEQHKITQFNYE
jgi:hypothetical protein